MVSGGELERTLGLARFHAVTSASGMECWLSWPCGCVATQTGGGAYELASCAEHLQGDQLASEIAPHNVERARRRRAARRRRQLAWIRRHR